MIYIKVNGKALPRFEVTEIEAFDETHVGVWDNASNRALCLCGLATTNDEQLAREDAQYIAQVMPLNPRREIYTSDSKGNLWIGDMPTPHLLHAVTKRAWEHGKAPASDWSLRTEDWKRQYGDHLVTLLADKEARVMLLELILREEVE